MAGKPQPILIGGQWRPGRGAELVSLDPATNMPVGSVAAADAGDVAVAAETGARVAVESGWGDALPQARAAVLHRIADGITARAEELARLQCRDNGKPILETRALVASAAGTFRYFAAVCETHEDAITPPRGAYVSMSVHEPLGVVGAITPWNSPVASDAQKVAPALAAGNAVLLKPSELTPLVALDLGRIAEAAGLPSGLLSVLPGPGADVGAAIVRHPLLAKVSFTGGTATGRAIGAMAAEKIMPLSLELGGKSPNIVFADADMDHALNGVLFGIFSSQGQSCIAGSRIFVERSAYDGFVARLVNRTRALRVGEPAAETTQIGPLISREHRARVAGYVDLARQEGGDVLCGGDVIEGPGFDAGNWFAPTVIAGLSNRARACREEIFGPVAVVLPFDDEDDLVAQANDSVYGLACGLWSADYKRLWRVARRIAAGTVWINMYKQFSISTPFGGLAESGHGREKGRQGLLAYMRQKSLYWGTGDRPIPWAD